MQAGEFDLIERIRARAGTRSDVLLGIGDDAALLAPRAGELLVLSCDTLNVDVHFARTARAVDIGHKALAVNLSDLAAMGAEPAWCTLALSLPEAVEAWLDAFLDGFLSLAERHGVALVGGDTTRGPLAVTVTVHGFVPATMVLRRAGARIGDDVWVTGSLGDAAAGLAADASPALRERLARPWPRVAAGLALRGLAHAAIDVSDGLAADLGHILQASGVGARIELERLPTSAELAGLDAAQRWALQTGGGDDYELCFCAAREHRTQILAALAATATTACVIGQIEAEPGLRLLDAQGNPWQPPCNGWQHFPAAQA